MTRFVRDLVLVLAVALLTLTASAQQPSSTPPAVATLRTSARLVVIDVVVRDKNGHPIHGLTRDDFNLSEAKQPQSLRSFEEYATPPAPLAPPQMPQLPPGLFTDFTPVASRGPLNVLVVDGLNTPVSDQQYLRQQLLDYTKQLAPGTRIAIFGLADHMYLLQGFTGDPAVIRGSLQAVKSAHNSTLLSNGSTGQEALTESLTDPSGGAADTSSSSALMTSATATFIEQIGVAQTGMRILETIDGFTALGRWLMNFPGRKNVIWFSAAFPLGVDPTASIQDNTDIPSEDSTVFRAMVNVLTQAQVSVYPVDPRGVQINPGFNASSTNLNQGQEFTNRSNSFFLNEAAEHSTMQAFASDTGGIPFYNRNNLAQAVADAIEDGANYYTLSYTPSETKTGGEWRSIHIALADSQAHKGVELSYRRGYFADDLKAPGYHTGSAKVAKDPTIPQRETRDYAHSAMLHGAPTPQDIPFTARVLPASTQTEQVLAADNLVSPKKPITPPFRRYDVDCAAAARYFNLAEQPNGNRVGVVQIAVLAYDKEGKLLNSVSRTLRIDLTPEEFAQFQRLGVRAHLEISVPAKGPSFLRVGIEEKTSGRVGALEVATGSVNNLPPPDYATPAAHQP